MRLNTSTKTCLPNVKAPNFVYGIGIDKTGDAQTDGTVYSTGFETYTLFNTRTNEYFYLKKITPSSDVGQFRGVAVDNTGTTWVVTSTGDGVWWFNKDIWSWGNPKPAPTEIYSPLLNNPGSWGFVPTGSQPTGVAIDSLGKVWVTNMGDSTAVRIDPAAATKKVDFVVLLPVGCRP